MAAQPAPERISDRAVIIIVVGVLLAAMCVAGAIIFRPERPAVAWAPPPASSAPCRRLRHQGRLAPRPTLGLSATAVRRGLEHFFPTMTPATFVDDRTGWNCDGAGPRVLLQLFGNADDLEECRLTWFFFRKLADPTLSSDASIVILRFLRNVTDDTLPLADWANASLKQLAKDPEALPSIVWRRRRFTMEGGISITIYVEPEASGGSR